MRTTAEEQSYYAASFRISTLSGMICGNCRHIIPESEDREKLSVYYPDLGGSQETFHHIDWYSTCRLNGDI